MYSGSPSTTLIIVIILFSFRCTGYDAEGVSLRTPRLHCLSKINASMCVRVFGKYGEKGHNDVISLLLWLIFQPIGDTLLPPFFFFPADTHTRAHTYWHV